MRITFVTRKFGNVERNSHCDVGETGVGWDKFWLGQCPSVRNESPDGETNYVFGEQVTTAFTGATCIIDARFASLISPKLTFFYKKVDSSLRVPFWAGKLVTRRIIVMAYVWRTMM